MVVTSAGLDGTTCLTKGTGGGDGRDDSSSSLRILTEKKETSLKIDYLFLKSNYSIKVIGLDIVNALHISTVVDRPGG